MIFVQVSFAVEIITHWLEIKWKTPRRKIKMSKQNKDTKPVPVIIEIPNQYRLKLFELLRQSEMYNSFIQDRIGIICNSLKINPEKNMIKYNIPKMTIEYEPIPVPVTALPETDKGLAPLVTPKTTYC